MNYKNLHLAFVAIITLFLTSCEIHKTPEDKTINVSDVSISGQAGEYIKVVDGEYVLKPIETKIVIAIKFELTKKYDLQNEPELGNISLVPLDETGASIPDIGLDFKPSSTSDYDKFKTFLKGEVGNTVIISFEWSYLLDTDRQNRIIDGTENFEITRADFTGEDSDKSSSNSYSASEEESEGVSYSPNGSAEMDKMLDSYEEYVDQYISFMKKAQSGDMSVMSEYPAMMEKAEEWGQSMEDAQEANEVSPAQMKRMLKIQAKMTNAAADMY